MEPITSTSPVIVAIALATWCHDNRYTRKSLHISKTLKKLTENKSAVRLSSSVNHSHAFVLSAVKSVDNYI